jgi:prevent-host-death family protein
VSSAYSTYEAKAKFSEVMRKVRRGQRVIVTYHGEPIAEISPVTSGAKGLRSRVAQLGASGELIPERGRFTLAAVARRPGALRRFLDDRG